MDQPTEAKALPLDGGNITRAHVIREAMRRVPRTPYGLPEGFYRADLIDPLTAVVGTSTIADSLGILDGSEDGAGGVLTEDVLRFDERKLRGAYVPLSYDEGYPTLPDGQPFWAQLTFEPLPCYYAFQAYLEQGTTGHRQLSALVADRQTQQRIAYSRGGEEIDEQELTDPRRPQLPGARGVAIQPRLMTRSSMNLDVDGGAQSAELQDWFILYAWGPRARAYDMFYVDSIRRSREMLSLAMENTHLIEATRLYNKIQLFIDPYDDNGLRKSNAPNEAFDDEGNARFWRDVTPKTLVDLLKVTTQLQRISVGLPASGPTANGGSKARTPGSATRDGAGSTFTAAPDLAHTETLSDDERVRRIGAILEAARSRRPVGVGVGVGADKEEESDGA